MSKVLIIGAGGVGGYLGARMLEAGMDTTFLVRGARLEQLRTKGLMVESAHGNSVQQVKTITKDDEGLDGFDIVVVAAKAYHIDADFLATLKQIDNGSNFVIPFLNGLNHMSQLEAIFGHDRTLGGLCRIATTLTPDGVVKHFYDTHEYVIGGQSNAGAAIANDLVQAMQGAKIDMLTTDKVEYSMWEKAYSLATLAAATCLMRAPIGCINSMVGGRRFMEDLTRETASIAAAYGFAPKPAFFKAVLDQQTDQNSSLTASMLRDLEAGGRVESNHIIGDLYVRGNAMGLDLPLLRLAKIHLGAAELRKARGQ